MSTNLITKLVGEISGYFIIPAYQRGYRWDEEVKMLLDDLNEITEGKEYCLQPIVVRGLGDEKYELIDGQQRLTTLFLLLNYIKTFRPKMAIKYSIDYEIRKNSKEFLSSIDFDHIVDEPHNIDEYFINKAVRSIKEWFDAQQDADNTASLLADKLNNKVKIIWYEIDSSEDASSLFTRLNIGKIPLTNAELVKAVFLSRDNGIDERHQLEIVTQWDLIENELHNEDFWAFLTNKKGDLFPTRIELIFDLMANKQDDDRERLRTLFYFQNQIKQIQNRKGNKMDVWRQVVEYFQRFKEWHNQSELYHKIGYLITVGQISLQELIKESATCSKKDFIKMLDKWISESIRFEKDYDELSYDIPSDKANIEKLLILFNVISAYKNGDKSLRFPFSEHKNKKGGWSLEHIHAQQSDGLKTAELWKEWLTLHVASLRSIDEERYHDLIEDINLSIPNITGERFHELFDKVINRLDLERSTDYIHSLSNMALLGRDDNSALNNSTFDVKRDKILEMDKKGDYIPICTRRVFLKYYTQSAHNQIHFWGEEDRKDYRAAINTILKPFMNKED